MQSFHGCICKSHVSIFIVNPTNPQSSFSPSNPSDPTSPEMPPDPTPKPSPPSSLLRALVHRHPILLRRGTPRNPNCGEVAGGTVANCAAILCYLPCGIVNLVVLATVRLPAGLCRKAIRERRDSEKKREKKGDGGGKLGSDDEFVFVGLKAKSGGAVVWPAVSPSPEMSKLEEEMWERFGKTGFWRSPSFKEN